MALYVFITKECQADAREHGFEVELRRFAERIEAEQRVTLFDSYPPPYLKKRFTRQIRLLAADRHFGEHVVVCFYRLLVRGGREYNDFKDNPLKFGDQHLAPLAADTTLQRWLQEKLIEPPPQPKPEPSALERTYLWEVLATPSSSAGDVFVCESRDWVDMVQNKKVNTLLHRVLDGLLAIADRELKTPQATEVSLSEPAGWSVLLRHFPQLRKFFLAAVFTPDTERRKSQLKDKYKKVLDESACVSEDDILRMSVRTYPIELLLDEEAWLKAERDEAANLALSPEETRTLESVHSMTRETAASGFPLFINGRAGSAKSTILQYLFGDYLQNYMAKGIGTDAKGPLYLTCSTTLLERSKQVVTSRLACSYRYMEHKRDLDDATRQKIDRAAAVCFQEFHGFLTSLLTSEERTQSFRPDRYVDYPKFKDLWAVKFRADREARRLYPHDICWHVIRTYIKGLSIDGYIDPEEYEELPKDERTISSESFERIYGRVWNNWYKALNEDLTWWDDQDLVRYLLSSERLRAEHPAVFADEAQDFTRIELEALFRLCVFSDRRLSPQELSRVPFAFAGDPFQTLNPTGFRWDAIKASFVDKFVKALDPAQQSQMKDLNYTELGFNYRSSASIVKVCNTIQALRSVLFDIPNLKPQSTWQYEEAAPPQVWFDRGDPDVARLLKEQADVTIIVPCEEGEEAEFVARDAFLKAVVSTDDVGVPKNVLSAIRSKGNEYERVVLYGFGVDSCASQLLRPLDDNVTFTREEQLTLEYFVNRLYVAASRARRRLYVIDSQEGLTSLWRLFTDPETQKKLTKRIRRYQDDWVNNLGILQQGTPDHWVSEGDDLEKLADQKWLDGRSRRDSYLLRQAAMAYQALRKEKMANECMALALRFEGKLKASGDLYLQQEAYDEALRSYWMGKEFGAVTDLSRRVARLSGTLEARFADFFSRTATVPAGAALLKEIVERLNVEEFRVCVLSDNLWLTAVSRLVDTLAERVPSGDFAEDWRVVDGELQTLVKKGITSRPSGEARIAFEVGDYGRAARLWEKTGETNHELYRKARRALLMRLVLDGQDADLTQEEKREAAIGLADSGRMEEACRILVLIGDRPGLVRLVQKQSPASAGPYLLDLFRVMIRSAEWSDLVLLLRDGKLRGEEAALSKHLEALLRDRPWYFHATVIVELSLSKALVEADNRKVKQPVSEYLKRTCFEDLATLVKYLNPEVVGAALERAGRDIECLQFYERVIRHEDFDEERRRRARVRWVKCKLRQSEREEAYGQKRMANKHAEEASNREREWDIREDELLTDYPDVGSFLAMKARRPLQDVTPANSIVALSPTGERRSEEVQKEQPVAPESRQPAVLNWRIDDLEIQFSPEEGRLNLSRGTQTAGIRLQNRKCASMDVEFSEVDGIFTCVAWNMTVDLSHVDKDGKLQLHLPSQHLTLQITV